MSKFSFNPVTVAIRKPTGVTPAPEPKFEVTMELELHPLVSFMKRFNRYEPKIKDSHSIKLLKECPRKFFYEIVLGFVTTEKYVVFAWGTSYHKFRETLERSYGLGPDAPASFDNAKAMDACLAAVNAGLGYWRKHGADQEIGSKFGFMTAERLVSSFKVAYKHWVLEKQRKQIEVIAVEQAFNVALRDGSRTSGRFDQLVRWNGALWGRDFKTTSKDSAWYARQLEPNDQFTRYTLSGSKLAGEQVQGILVELLYNGNPTKNDKKGPTIIELTTSRTQAQLDEFEREQAVINRVLQVYRETDTWPMHEGTCPYCQFHSVCTRASEADMMGQLEQHFVVRPWDNTKVGVTEE